MLVHISRSTQVSDFEVEGPAIRGAGLGGAVGECPYALPDELGVRLTADAEVCETPERL
jgi:hypothetical protein